MRLPLSAVALGVLGLVPFFACGLLAVTGDPVVAPRALFALIGYGAVILSFVGGVHWGFALPTLPAATGPLSLPGPLPEPLPGLLAGQAVPAQGRRLLGGVLPSLVGWGALLLAIYAWDDTALLVLVAGFIAVIIAEARANRLGLMPAGYIWLRWVLTAGVLICLVSVVILRLLGGNIVL